MRSHRDGRAWKRRGAVLVVVVATALLSAVAVYTIMLITLSQARQATFFQDRAVSVNKAEGALVWAQQQLWTNPALCGPQTTPTLIFDPPVTVNITNCAGPVRTLTATVTY